MVDTKTMDATPAKPTQGPIKPASGGVLWPALTAVAVAVVTLVVVRLMGQPWWCVCGEPRLFVAEAFSQHNSQHLLDTYTASHFLHGVIFCGVLAVVARRLTVAWRLAAATLLEGGWEVLENSPIIIERYRAATAALGYSGDSVVNCGSDLIACAAGFVFAQRLGWKWSVATFVVLELTFLWWMRDNLTLNVIMLTWPIESLKTWQMGG
jgi:hypothetical protein